MRPSHSLTLLAAASMLSACGFMGGKQPATLQTMAKAEVAVKPDDVETIGDAQAMKAYRQLLDGGAPDAALRAEALRRMADMELDRADKVNADAGQAAAQDAAAGYRLVIARYQEQLAAHPNASNRDQVMYQLARAQEQAGELEAALQTLTDLVKQHPSTSNLDEVQFRRGELAFSLGQYAVAEPAYLSLVRPDHANAFRDRAMYMLGWSRFKQGQFDAALQTYFNVLDAKLAAAPGSQKLSTPDRFNRADRELLSDTFRGVSLSLSNLKGAESIAAYTPASKPLRQAYALFVYEQLGEFYAKQDKHKEAGDTYNLFVKLNPLDTQAPRIQGLAIDAYDRADQAALALEAKKQFVNLFGRESGLRMGNAKTWRQAQPRVQTCLNDLARHYHAQAQSSKNPQDYREAVNWYRELLNTFPNDTQVVRTNFLLAEALFESGVYGEAAVEYERVAYDYPWHDKAAEAGYAALLSHAKMRKDADPLTLSRLQRAAVMSALRFAKTFPGNERSPQVMTDAAEQLYALKDGDQAGRVAMKIIDLKPPATEAQRRVAWTILAHTAYERKAYLLAEQAYTRLMELSSPQDAAYKDLAENQLASLYKLAEQEKAAGNLKDAAGHFKKVSETASQPSARANAQFDAASAYIDIKDWANAQPLLEDFRQRYPKHALQADVAPKLALAYGEQGKWSLAANEMERMLAAGPKDANLAKDLMWQVASYREKAGEKPAAARAYERYLAQLQAMRPVPLAQTLEVRDKLVNLARDEGNAKREMALLKEIYEADLKGGAARTDRTRYLGAHAALVLAEPAVKAYRGVALVEPLQKQLKVKKARLEEALQAYALASEPGVADVSTAVTYQVASLYRDFGKAILGSQRPKKLSEVELEQYNVLLEEQALPFEEKASDMHEVNARRAVAGVYDPWVQRSFDALAEMLPVRYGKREKGEGIDLAAAPERLKEQVASLEAAVKQSPRQAAQLNQLGVVYRQLGQFDKARSAYEKAMAADANYAPAVLNMGILSDLYRGDATRALPLYERYLALTPQGDAAVAKWVTEIKRRKPAAPAPAGKDAT